MFEIQINSAKELLRSKGYKLTKGLSEDEINKVECLYKIIFPPELKELLMIFNPYQFYDWANFSQSNVSLIEKSIYWPIEGILFDIKENSFWSENWGEKPQDINKSLEIAEIYLNKAPKLIPIYSHRYIPSIENQIGNPVYSVHRTDIIYYGENLWDYFDIEFDNLKYEDKTFENVNKDIPFWSNLIE